MERPSQPSVAATLRKLTALLLTLALAAAACGSDGDTEAAGGEVDGDKPTINFVVNPWTASALNVEVARAIIESELGYPTEVVNIDENEAMFTGLADGTADAVLEIWPSGITESEQAFFDDGSVENLGELGAVGRIGWFVPSYVIDENPALASWEGFDDPAVGALFATPESGDNGRFLGTDPSYSTFDEQIIDNLDLPFEVFYSGSEAATVAELDARVAASRTGAHVLVDPDGRRLEIRPGESRVAGLQRRLRRQYGLRRRRGSTATTPKM